MGDQTLNLKVDAQVGDNRHSLGPELVGSGHICETHGEEKPFIG